LEPIKYLKHSVSRELNPLDGELDGSSGIGQHDPARGWVRVGSGNGIEAEAGWAAPATKAAVSLKKQKPPLSLPTDREEGGF
jgi:hypothetical protein